MSTKKVATTSKEITKDTVELSLEALMGLKASPYQIEGRSDLGRMALALELSNDGQHNPMLIGIFADESDPCTVQGHRRSESHIFGRSAGMAMPPIAVRVKVYKSLKDPKLIKDTNDHGSTVGIENQWQLYLAVKALLGTGLTYGEIAYKLLSAFNHCFKRDPAKEAKIKSFEEAAESLAMTGKTASAAEQIKLATAEMGLFRNGAMQTYASLKKLADAGFTEAEDHAKKQWTQGLSEYEKVLSQGPLVALAACAEKSGVDSEEFEALYEEKSHKTPEEPKPKALSKAKIDAHIAAGTHEIVKAVLEAVKTGDETMLKCIASDLIAEKVKAKFETCKKLAASRVPAKK